MNKNNIPYSGNVSSYGYDVYFEVKHQVRTYKFNFHKHQTSPSSKGLLIRNARNYSFTNFKVNSGMDDIIKVNRIFPFESLLRGAIKYKMDKQFHFLTSRDINQKSIDKLLAFCKFTDLVFLKSSPLKTHGSIRNTALDPLEIIYVIEKYLIQKPLI
ncbi:hypothetical protein [Echinicola shivajiensis]|uniref:hypothetical protein n=1 Tax=Echinicola shivajiensis TaxID=1035916 RepID=UPI001BFC9425|nr:hypothetical protein [Echinicola shivajiensis]